ncbi:hypothetical protein GCM10009555_042700 [Acrocarpospora macrocephala]|uniref:Uncharacterized protein n=1 Tax=Acrocarpospora macrocephala TaxID=150177 RepID=A0A5M3XAR6_9ACTN|nr:hypothetical protein Amac_101990 [Acrocarpospora macrocephala]
MGSDVDESAEGTDCPMPACDAETDDSKVEGNRGGDAEADESADSPILVSEAYDLAAKGGVEVNGEGFDLRVGSAAVSWGDSGVVVRWARSWPGVQSAFRGIDGQT